MPATNYPTAIVRWRGTCPHLEAIGVHEALEVVDA